ncbi:hypothetical protein Tco_1008416 [Tanacetum coccineum]
MAFVITPSSTNEVNTTNVQVSTANSTVSIDSTLDSTANLSDATVYAFLANQPNRSQLAQEGLNVEDISSKAMVAIDGAGFDWSYMADKEVPTNLALMAFSNSEEFQQPEFEGYGFKANKSDESEVKDIKSDNVQQKPKQANQPRKVSENPRYNRTNWNEKKTQKLGVGFQFTKKACFVCGSLNHLIKDCDFHIKKEGFRKKPMLNNVKRGTGQREVRLVWNNAMRVKHQNFSNSRRNFIPTAVLIKSGIVPVSTARPINTVVPKSFVNATKTRPNAFQKSHSPSRRPFYQHYAL